MMLGISPTGLSAFYKQPCIFVRPAVGHKYLNMNIYYYQDCVHVFVNLKMLHLYLILKIKYVEIVMSLEKYEEFYRAITLEDDS